MTGRWSDQEGAIPFVVVGLATLGSVLGLAWMGQEWAQGLMHEAGGELTEWVLKSAFWGLDLIALQASTAPVSRDWYTPVIEGVALPIYALAALVMVATLIAEVIAGMVTGNTTRTVQAVFRALVAGMMASAGGALLLSVGGALSELGRTALGASGTSVDAPLVPLQEVLMESALRRDSGAELFVVFLAGLVIVFCSLAIYFTLAMRPVLLAALIVFLPVAHALSVWTPLRRVQIRAWALAFAVLLADAAILTMFAITNTVTGQPEGVDRLIFGTFGLLLAALAPAALARIVGTPELHTAVQSMSRGSRVIAAGAGYAAWKGALWARSSVKGRSAAGAAPAGLLGPPGGGGGTAGPGGRPAGSGPGSGGGGAGAARSATASSRTTTTSPSTSSKATTSSQPSATTASRSQATATAPAGSSGWRTAVTRTSGGVARG